MRTDPILRNRQVGKLRLLVDNIDLGPMLPLKSMKVPMVRALAKSHISIYGLSCCGEHVEACCPCCSQKPWGCLWSKVPSETIYKSISHEERVDAHRLCSHWRPCGCWWSVLLLETEVMYMDQTACQGYMGIYGLWPRGHIDIWGLCYHREPW